MYHCKANDQERRGRNGSIRVGMKKGKSRPETPRPARKYGDPGGLLLEFVCDVSLMAVKDNVKAFEEGEKKTTEDRGMARDARSG